MEDIQYVKNRVSYIISEFGDGKTEFNTRDINRLLDQLGIEEQQNEMLIEELHHNKQLLTESLETLKWMFEHMAVVDQNLQSDAFNLPANTITNLENHLQIQK